MSSWHCIYASRFIEISKKSVFDLECQWVNHQKDGGDGGVLKDLPGSMKMRLKVAQNHNRIRSIPVFTDVPQECVLALIERLRSTIAV